jgi:microcystin degradation protein MlrC
MAWERRRDFFVEKTPMAEAVQKAQAGDRRSFIQADPADSVTRGANSDGNVLPRALLAIGPADSALLTLADDAAGCHAGGVAEEITQRQHT